MVVGEGWIVVVVGGFVFTGVVCVDLVLVVVVASVVRFLQFFFVAGCYACCSSCCICYCGCFCSRCSCSFSCALLRFITVVAAFIAVVLFSGSGLVAFRPCRCLLPRGSVAAVSRCCRLSRTVAAVAGYARFIFVRLQNERRDLALDQIAPFRRMAESIRPRPFHRPEARGRLRRLKFSLGLWPEWAWPVRPGIACDIC